VAVCSFAAELRQNLPNSKQNVLANSFKICGFFATDGDGKIDALDTNSDSDGLSDRVEAAIGIEDPRSADSDGDGIPCVHDLL
jgi:hypothetical protein